MYWCRSSEIRNWWNSTRSNKYYLDETALETPLCSTGADFSILIFEEVSLQSFLHSSRLFLSCRYRFLAKKNVDLETIFLLTFFGIKILIFLLSSAIFAIIQFMQCMFPTIILWFTFLKWNRSFVFLYQGSNTCSMSRVHMIES